MFGIFCSSSRVTAFTLTLPLRATAGADDTPASPSSEPLSGAGDGRPACSCASGDDLAPPALVATVGDDEAWTGLGRESLRGGGPQDPMVAATSKSPARAEGRNTGKPHRRGAVQPGGVRVILGQLALRAGSHRAHIKHTQHVSRGSKCIGPPQWVQRRAPLGRSPFLKTGMLISRCVTAMSLSVCAFSGHTFRAWGAVADSERVAHQCSESIRAAQEFCKVPMKKVPIPSQEV
jgi:hypothetical protein